MKWYVWLPWVLLGLAICGVVIWYFVQRARLATLRTKLAGMESLTANKISALEAEARVKLAAQEVATKKALAKLEEAYKSKLDNLTEEEKVKYEEAKKDPQVGVDVVLGFLGDGGSGPG